MSNTFNIHNLIENYEEENYEDIQWNIASRKEFNDLKGERKEKIPEKGQYYNHQNIILRYMKQYDKIFNIHETGTGKTGSMINVAEYLRKNKPESAKKVYVLEPGPNTVDDFKDQIIKLTDDKCYSNKTIETSENDIALKNNLTRLINKNYEVTTYQKFIKDDLRTEDIEEYYSDCVFFLDEAHKLRNLRDSNDGELSEEQLTKIYDYIWKVLHISKRIKIIISSATPMINDTRDFVPLLNLLLKENEQLPLFKDDSFYENLTLEQLEPYFRGKFTYVRFLDTGIDVVNKGIMIDKTYKIDYPVNGKNNEIKPISKIIRNGEIEISDKTKKFNILKNQPVNKTKEKKIKSQITIFPTVMKGEQLESFLKVEKLKKDSFRREIKQCSTFVFPNGEYGKRGFSTYIEKNEYDEYIFKKKIFSKGTELVPLGSIIDSRDMTRTLNNLSRMSSKFSFFIKNELENSEKEKPGSCFCYIDQVTGSGSILLGLILEKLGFENYKSNDSSVIDKDGNIRDYFKKSKRFCLFTGSSGNIKNTLKIFNNPNNQYGEYIQIIIASEVARDGINLENVVRGYMMTPGWHESGMHQAMSRFIRATSHENLINSNKIMLKEQGKRYTNYRLKVEVFRLASVKPEEASLEKIENPSNDIYSYLAAELKDIKIKRILRYMKECSFDAYLNYDRNVIEEKEDYTKENDYNTRQIKIWKARGEPGNKKRKGMADNQGPSTDDYIYTTYDSLYYNTYKSFIEDNILFPMLEENNFVNIDHFVEEVKKNEFLRNKVTDYSIYSVISDIITSEEWLVFEDDIYPFVIKIYGNLLVKQQPSIQNVDDFLNTEFEYYFQNKINDNINLDSLKIKDSKNLELELKGKSPEFITDYYAKNQNFEEFYNLIEESLIKELNNEATQLNKTIIELFYNYILLIKIPVGWIEKAKDALKPVEERTQGRNRSETSTAGLKDLDLSKVDPGYSKTKTYIHFYRGSDKSGFNITSILEGKEKKIRILDGDKFRNADIPENFVYTYMFNVIWDKEILQKYKKSRYYGSYIYRGGEQVKLFTLRQREFFRIIDNKNPRNKGRVCTNMTPSSTLQDVLKYIDKEKKYKDLYTGKINKNKVCEIIKDLFIKNDLLFVSL